MLGFVGQRIADLEKAMSKNTLWESTKYDDMVDLLEPIALYQDLSRGFERVESKYSYCLRLTTVNQMNLFLKDFSGYYEKMQRIRQKIPKTILALYAKLAFESIRCAIKASGPFVKELNKQFKTGGDGRFDTDLEKSLKENAVAFAAQAGMLSQSPILATLGLLVLLVKAFKEAGDEARKVGEQYQQEILQFFSIWEESMKSLRKGLPQLLTVIEEDHDYYAQYGKVNNRRVSSFDDMESRDLIRLANLFS